MKVSAFFCLDPANLLIILFIFQSFSCLSLYSIKPEILKTVRENTSKDSRSPVRLRRTVPVSEELEFYRLANKIDPVALKVLMSNMTEEPFVLTTPSRHCCYNGGTCNIPTYDSEQRWCSCPANFTGRYCHIDVNECLSPGPCAENELCINTFGSYKCFCEEGFVRDGYKCVRKTNCFEDPCLNFAGCIDREDGRITCICRLGYVGERCEKKIMECDETSCTVDEICVATPKGFQCVPVP